MGSQTSGSFWYITRWAAWYVPLLSLVYLWGGLMYSLAFSGLFVGLAVRFSRRQHEIGFDDEDEMVNWYHLWDRRVHYYCN